MLEHLEETKPQTKIKYCILQLPLWSSPLLATLSKQWRYYHSLSRWGETESHIYNRNKPITPDIWYLCVECLSVWYWYYEERRGLTVAWLYISCPVLADSERLTASSAWLHAVLSTEHCHYYTGLCTMVTEEKGQDHYNYQLLVVWFCLLWGDFMSASFPSLEYV